MGQVHTKVGQGDLTTALKDIFAHTFRNCINKCSCDETGTQAVGTMRTYSESFIRTHTDTIRLRNYYYIEAIAAGKVRTVISKP